MSCTDNTFMHKHHIIPRYKGGTDAPENLVEVTITQHAMYHFCNYQLWGNEEDRIAWRGLSGQLDSDEFNSEKMSFFAKKAYSALLEKHPDIIQRMSSPEIIEKKKQKFKEIKHQQGHKNSQYGKVWITDGTEKGSTKIKKGNPIPEGFYLGRVTKEKSNFIYTIITPNNEIIKTRYIGQFCKENNLCKYSMCKVATKKRKHYRGYKVYREEVTTP